MDYNVIQNSWQNHLTESDFWQVEGVKVPIISHRGVERLAKVFNVEVFHYDWVSSIPEFLLVIIGVQSDDGVHKVYEVGEASPSNLSQNISADYPASMAWKRAYDRAVLKLLGIEAYSAEESSDFSPNNTYKKPQLNRPIGQASSPATPVSPPQVTTQTQVVQPLTTPQTTKPLLTPPQTQANTQWVNNQTVNNQANPQVTPVNSPQVNSPQVGQPMGSGLVQGVKPTTPNPFIRPQPSSQPNLGSQPLGQQHLGSQPQVPNTSVTPPVNSTPVNLPQSSSKPITTPQIIAINKTIEMLNMKLERQGQPLFDLTNYLQRDVNSLSSDEAGNLIRELTGMMTQ